MLGVAALSSHHSDPKQTNTQAATKLALLTEKSKHTDAFVTFEDDRDAEDAKDANDGKQLDGCRLNIEWAKESGRRGADSGGGRGGPGGSFVCYNCQEEGS